MLKSRTRANWLCAAAFIMTLVGCAPAVRVHPVSDASLKHGLSVNQGLVYGRLVVRGWSPTVQGDEGTSVEFRNRTTGQTFTHRLNALGEFHWLLVTGSYELTEIWSGLEGVSQQAKDRGIYFNVPAGGAAYLGDLFVQLPSLYANGSVDILDDFTTATRYLRRRYPSLKLAEAPAKQLFTNPTTRK